MRKQHFLSKYGKPAQNFSKIYGELIFCMQAGDSK